MKLQIGDQIIDVERQLAELDRVDYEESLYKFLRAGWRYIDPAGWTDGWAIEAVAEHCEAVIHGQIRKLLINIPPRMSKPVGQNEIISTRRGLIPLREVVVGDEVLTHMGRFRRVSAVHVQGELDVVRLTTRHERALIAAPDHPVLTPEGWREISQVGPDDVVATIPQYIESGEAAMSSERARLMGYLIGDGSCKGTPNITVADDIEAADIEHCIRSMGWHPQAESYHMANTGYLLRRIAIKMPVDYAHPRKLGYRGPVRQFMEANKLYGMSSYTKMVPDDVMRGSNEVVTNFIGAYWACDGFVTTKGAKRDGTEREDLVLGCDSVNKGFLLQMQILLLRLGISSRLRKKTARFKTKRQGDIYTSYSLALAVQDDCWRFASLITIPHTKGLKLAAAYRRRFDFDHRLRGEVVDSVVPAGREECICLTVDEDESFVANGFAVHNSSLVSVALPAWTWAQPERYWGPNSGPHVQFMSASYAEKLSLRDNVKCRRLIQSAWYQKHWGNRFRLSSDQNVKSRFSNDRGGERIITSIGGSTTGEGFNVGLIDDANNAAEALSEAVTTSTNDWWDQTFSTRMNDPKTGAWIGVQQRLAEDDWTGHVLSSEESGIVHLCLPMRYEPERSYHNVLGYDLDDQPITWQDPRTEPGELLWPERFGEEEVDNLRKVLGPFGFSGQMQQSPAPAGGGVIKREWWQLWEDAAFPPMDYILASLDTAYTEKTMNDPSAMTVWGVFTTDPVAIASRMINAEGRPEYLPRTFTEQAPKVMLMAAWSERLEFHDLVLKVAETAKRLRVDKILVEAKASGHSVAQELRRVYAGEGFAVQLHDPKSQDKLSRLYSVQHLFADGTIYAPDRKWSDDVITEVEAFPKGKHDDRVDTVSQALRHLRDLGLLIRAPERLAEIDEMRQYAGKPPGALYPS